MTALIRTVNCRCRRFKKEPLNNFKLKPKYFSHLFFHLIRVFVVVVVVDVVLFE